MDQTVIKLASTATQSAFQRGGAVGNELKDCSFTDFTIDGSEAPTGKGFFFTDFQRIHWTRVRVTGTPATGFGVDFPLESTMTNCIVVGNDRRGLFIERPSRLARVAARIRGLLQLR